MNCPHCGAQMPATAKFCTFCGAPLTPPQAPAPPPRGGGKRPSSLKPLAIVLAVLAVTFGIVLTLILVRRGGGAQGYDDCMALAARYLEELDFEQAEAMYLEALQLDPSQVEAYRALAEMYVEQERLEDALDILQRGIDATGSAELQQMYDELRARLEAEAEPETAPESGTESGREPEPGAEPESEPEPEDVEAALTSYLEDTLIPELGMCETGPFAGYMDFDNRITGVSGVISSLIEDLDGDGQAELLVAVMDGHNAAQEYDELNPNNAVCLQVYEYTGSDVDLADEYLALTNVLYTGEIENDWIFLKTVGGVRYLCGSKENSSFLMADGAAYQLFLISYNGTRFLEHAQFNSIGSWLFEDPDLIAFADTLRSIGGFNASLPYMEDLPYFPTTEDYDAVLLSIHGKNEYYDRLLWNEDNWEASSALYESLRDRYNETGDISVWGLTTFEIYPNELPLSFQEE